MAIRVGVVLSGCGVFDGSEIHEAVSVLIALDQRGAAVVCMAPDVPQAQVINHLTHKPETAQRGVLVESARIARGAVRDLASVQAQDLDALVFPGGFGAAKNLCTFAVDGPLCKVNPHVQRLILDMHAQGKPIGLACIAPVIAARVLGSAGKSPLVTIGTDTATASAVQAMNARHSDTATTDICVDPANRLVTTPCYMTAAGPWQVFQGAQKMVDAVLEMTQGSMR